MRSISIQRWSFFQPQELQGFIDPHIHMVKGGMSLTMPDISLVSSISGLQSVIRQACSESLTLLLHIAEANFSSQMLRLSCESAKHTNCVRTYLQMPLIRKFTSTD